MPLNDREQRILAEIERQFYQDDPDLAHAVRNIKRSTRIGLRLPIVGLLTGALMVAFTFTRYTVAALAGFALMVLSATLLVHALRVRGLAASETGSSSVKRRTWPFGQS
jgi:hypothetical protein